MTPIEIPAHAVVVAIGGRHAPFAETLDLVPARAMPWNTDRPEDSAAALHAALGEGGRVRVAMPRAHAKAVGDVAAIARKHGAATVVLRLPGAPDVTAGLARVSAVHDIDGPEGLSFSIVPMPSDLRHLSGGFDMVGDIHGVHEELVELMTLLGHMVDGVPVRHADGRRPVFLGDYTDRGPANVLVLETVRAYTRIGGIAIAGNHDVKLAKALKGRNIKVAAGLAMTLAETDLQTEEWRLSMAEWLESLQTHHLLDGGRLVVAHAGLDEELHGRHTGAAESQALYGKTLDGGKTLDADGFPAAADWALDYQGAATVVHGHVVYPEPRIVTNANGGAVVGLDLGAVFGGSLAAYRWPEREIVTVKARRTWFEPKGRQVKP